MVAAMVIVIPTAVGEWSHYPHFFEQCLLRSSPKALAPSWPCLSIIPVKVHSRQFLLSQCTTSLFAILLQRHLPTAFHPSTSDSNKGMRNTMRDNLIVASIKPSRLAAYKSNFLLPQVLIPTPSLIQPNTFAPSTST